MPKVATTRIQSTLPVKAGETLVLSGMQETKDGKQEAFVALMTCYLPYSDNEEVRYPTPKNHSKPSNAQTSAPAYPTKLIPVQGEQMVDGKLTTVHYSVAEQDYQMRGGETLGVIIKQVLDPNSEAPPLGGIPQPISQPEMGYPIPVTADGFISLPLLDKFSVIHMTPKEIVTETRRRYAEADIQKDAKVTVRIRNTSGKTDAKPQPIRIKGKPLHGQSQPKNYKPLIDAIEQHKVDVEIEGEIDFEIKDNFEMSLESEHLSIDAGDDFQVSGKHGRIEFSEHQNMSMHFNGDVKMKYSDMNIEADELVFGEGEKAEFTMDLKGNASLVTEKDAEADEKWDMKADRIYYDDASERLILLGNVKFVRDADGKSKTHTGERVELNTTTDEVHVIK